MELTITSLIEVLEHEWFLMAECLLFGVAVYFYSQNITINKKTSSSSIRSYRLYQVFAVMTVIGIADLGLSVSPVNWFQVMVVQACFLMTDVSLRKYLSKVS